MRIRPQIPDASRAARASRRHAAGFTIVEMMVALTIGLFIVGALIVVVLGGSSANTSRERASELQSNGRYAIDQIRRDVLHSGFLGISSLFYPDVSITPGITVTNTCTPDVGRLSQRIWGADSNPFSATCIPAANYLRGDVLMIRGLSPVPESAPFASNLAYYHSSYEGGQPFVGPTAPDFTGTSKYPPYEDHRIVETVYYISPYTTAPSENPQIPALYRLRLGAGPAMVPELVASGVENLQIRYGVFQTNDTTRYLAAADVAASEWDLVRSVQVFLLMRAASAEPGYTDTATYAMGGSNYTVNDGFPRLMLTAVIQQRN